MCEHASIVKLAIPKEKRVICISDIHGHLDLLIQLLEKLCFSREDMLFLLGDYYSKGPQSRATLQYVMDLCRQPNVYAIRGNGDLIREDFDDSEKKWIRSLPHIIETQDYTFVHAGLTSKALSEQKASACMKNDAFMEEGLEFDKYIITGHWPTANYCHQIPCHNPIINEENRIIAIDGGTFKSGGQLNAFIIHNDRFAFDYVDSLPAFRMEKEQAEGGGMINITWNDRFVELMEAGEEFGLYRHKNTGRELRIPHVATWKDDSGNLCAANLATDYCLPVRAGERVYVVKRFGDLLFAKKGGVMGWVDLQS